MDSISKKITSRPGFSKAILVIRVKIVCFKEDKQLFSDFCLLLLDMSEVIALGQ